MLILQQMEFAKVILGAQFNFCSSAKNSINAAFIF